MRMIKLKSDENMIKMVRIEELRIKTFEIRKWPQENPKPIKFAQSGFFYCLPSSRRVLFDWLTL